MRTLDRLIIAALLCLWGAVMLPATSWAEEPLAIVVAAGVHRAELDRDDLAAIFGRKKRFWEDGTRIDPVNLPAADPRRRRFSHWIFGLAPEQMEAYWNEMYFHGVQPPYVVSSVEAVLRYVSMSRGAIGYVPLCSADGRVAVLLAVDEAGGLTRKPSLSTCRP